MAWIFWAFVVAAFIHVVEETFGNWVDWAKFFVPDLTWGQFAVVNFLFLALCVAAAFIGEKQLVFSLAVGALIFVNALVHIVPTIRMKRYSPGLISSIFLYIPLPAFAFFHYYKAGAIGFSEILVSLVLGVLVMTVPFVFQLVRLKIKGEKIQLPKF